MWAGWAGLVLLLDVLAQDGDGAPSAELVDAIRTTAAWPAGSGAQGREFLSQAAGRSRSGCECAEMTRHAFRGGYPRI